MELAQLEEYMMKGDDGKWTSPEAVSRNVIIQA